MRELYAAVLLEIVQTKPSIPHVNGDVEEAMKAAKEAQDNYDAFLRLVAAVQTVKV